MSQCEDIPLAMCREHLRDLPEAVFPAGYGMRPLAREEGALWTEVQRDTERVIPITDHTFEEQFGADPEAIPQRCSLLVTAESRAVGAISAWYGRDAQGDFGRIHWFAIRPAFQGRGLARPALSFALHQLARWHTRAWHTTSSSRLPALKLYLDYGFTPDFSQPRALEAWQQVQGRLHHPALAVLFGPSPPSPG
jgi:GNAT superfamily N-acetyltransferase